MNEIEKLLIAENAKDMFNTLLDRGIERADRVLVIMDVDGQLELLALKVRNAFELIGLLYKSIDIGSDF